MEGSIKCSLSTKEKKTSSFGMEKFRYFERTTEKNYQV